ncbi:MAG: hypothetical protein PHP86_18765 [Nevskiales bacterium]|nr:hypothetical protein [Nevskiales bacterium]
MSMLRAFLLLATVAIFGVTFIAVEAQGYNWPAVYFGDLIAADWRSQFNTDFLIHLFLLALWIAWRHRFSGIGFVFGFFSIFWGGMFTFPYLLVETYRARGDARAILLGARAGP